MRKTDLRVTLAWLVAALFLSPLLLLPLSALSPYLAWPDLWPDRMTFQSFTSVFVVSIDFWEALATSILLALCVTLLNLCLALPASDALARYEFRFKKTIELFLLLPLLLPPLAIMMGLHGSFIRIGLSGSFFGVLLAHTLPTLPYMIRALALSYYHLDSDFEKQAELFGASRWRIFRYVTFPMLLPGIIAGSALSFIISLGQYILTLFIGGGMVKTLPVLAFPYLSGGDQSIGAVHGIVMALLSILFLLLMDRALRRYYER